MPNNLLISLENSVVVASKDGDQSTYIFRSYDHTDGDIMTIKNPGPADEHAIWMVARATSAAPTYFDPIEIDGELYSDGGMGYNNPVTLVLDEVLSKSSTVGPCLMTKVLDLLLSIGTGQKPSKKSKVERKLPLVKRLVSKLHLVSVLNRLKIEATDVDKDHSAIQRTAVQTEFKGYFRWTGGETVGGLDLDEWLQERIGKKPATKKFIEDAIDHYMDDSEIKSQLKSAAQIMVDRRRARYQDPDRHKYKRFRGKYGRFTHCNLLHCSSCDHGTTWMETEEALVQHAVQYHNIPEESARVAVAEQAHVSPRQFGGPV